MSLALAIVFELLGDGVFVKSGRAVSNSFLFVFELSLKLFVFVGAVDFVLD